MVAVGWAPALSVRAEQGTAEALVTFRRAIESLGRLIAACTTVTDMGGRSNVPMGAALAVAARALEQRPDVPATPGQYASDLICARLALLVRL